MILYDLKILKQIQDNIDKVIINIPQLLFINS